MLKELLDVFRRASPLNEAYNDSHVRSPRP